MMGIDSHGLLHLRTVLGLSKPDESSSMGNGRLPGEELCQPAFQNGLDDAFVFLGSEGACGINHDSSGPHEIQRPHQKLLL
jgi:hypothetical protein